MASLKETKSRIASVKNTLQISSAMKMVASAKLRRAQQAIAALAPYQEKLHEILQRLLCEGGKQGPPDFPLLRENGSGRVTLVAFSSNSSLCGSFNTTAVKSLLAELQSLEESGLERDMIDIYPVGKKVSDAVRKCGFTAREDCSHLLDKPSFDSAAAFADKLAGSFEEGGTGSVILLYNHYKSNASQPPVREICLPLSLPESLPAAEDETIIEPGRKEMLDALLPRILQLKIYSVLMDSCAAEQAARTVAMQTASDNADELLEQLTLEYNKRRQQAITSELLDIVGGSLTQKTI